MIGKIRKCDYSGDSELAKYDSDDPKSVKVAQDKLTEFLEGCVKQHGQKPPVWARRIGKTEFEPFTPVSDSLTEVDEVVCQLPLVGG